MEAVQRHVRACRYSLDAAAAARFLTIQMARPHQRSRARKDAREPEARRRPVLPGVRSRGDDCVSGLFGKSQLHKRGTSAGIPIELPPVAWRFQASGNAE